MKGCPHDNTFFALKWLFLCVLCRQPKHIFLKTVMFNHFFQLVSVFFMLCLHFAHRGFLPIPRLVFSTTVS